MSFRNIKSAPFLMVLKALVFFAMVPLWADDIPSPDLKVPSLDEHHEIFDGILKRIAKNSGVDYALLKDELRSDLDRYLAQLAKAPQYENKKERMALLINAYNAFTLALVVDRLPEDRGQWKEWSIKKLGGWFSNVWKTYRFELAGQWLTLDQIEHEHLRPMGDARIHFAVNCASRSCPPLANRAYRADHLDQQLEAASVAFASSQEHVRLESGVVVVNPILKWFGEDFGHEPGVKAFLKKRTSKKIQEALTSGKALKYFEYDWKLNLP